MNYPHRAHEFICKIGADTKEDLVAELFRFAHMIERDEITAGVSGAPSAGSIYAWRHDPEQTHESYFAELDAALERERAAK